MSEDKLEGGVTGKGFQKGKSGNPTGRPKTKTILKALKSIGNEPYNDDLTNIEYICRLVVEKALKGEISWVKLYFERLDGKHFVNHNVNVDMHHDQDQPIKVFDIETEAEARERVLSEYEIVDDPKLPKPVAIKKVSEI